MRCPELFSDPGELDRNCATDQRTNDRVGCQGPKASTCSRSCLRHRGGIAGTEGEHIVQAPSRTVGLLREYSLEQRWKVREMVVDQLTTDPCLLRHRHHREPVQPISRDQP